LRTSRIQLPLREILLLNFMQTVLRRDLGVRSAALLVVASMLGTGIFGTTGIIQAEVGSAFFVILLWVVGGLVALSGALCYADLAVQMPHAGGDYIYINRIFGPLPSFLNGWVSFIAGFSAPIASSALLTGEYASEFFRVIWPGSALADFFSGTWNRKFLAAALIVVLTLVHTRGVRRGSLIQNFLSLLNIFIVLGFALVGLYLALQKSDTMTVFARESPRSFWGLGIGLMWVMFAYTGYNGATYLAEEVKDPRRNLPRALILGTIGTAGLYLILNLLYFLSTPIAELSGEKAVAALAARHLFGPGTAGMLNFMFCLILIASISAQIMIGPRVYFAMARDHLFFKMAAEIHPHSGTPVKAIVLQSALSIFYVITGTFEEIITFMIFALSIFPVLAVSGLIIRRRKFPAESIFPHPGFLFFPVFFIFFSVLMIVAAFITWTGTSLFALAAVACGIPVFFLWTHFAGRRQKHAH